MFVINETNGANEYELSARITVVINDKKIIKSE